MRIIFFGTSHGVPEPHRRCSSYILEVEGRYYLIDMGANVTEELRRRGIPMEAVRLAICTHPHGDHTDGLIQFADLLNWYFKKADPLILLPDERLIGPLKAWLTAVDDGKPPRDLKNHRRALHDRSGEQETRRRERRSGPIPSRQSAR